MSGAECDVATVLPPSSGSESEDEDFVDAMEQMELRGEKVVSFSSPTEAGRGTDDGAAHGGGISEHVETPRQGTDASPSSGGEGDCDNVSNDACLKSDRLCDKPSLASDRDPSESELNQSSPADAQPQEGTHEHSPESPVERSPETDVVPDSFGDEDETEEATEAEDRESQEQRLKDLEAQLSEEEKEARRQTAQTHKCEGNDRFKAENFHGAVASYTDALSVCPLAYPKDRSIMYSNRAAAKLKLEEFDGATEDCTRALDLNPVYLKALLRRAEVYDKTEKLDDALADYTKALEMDPSLVAARRRCQQLPGEINERNEKMKTEMMGKLKDLGNMVLRPFGLSTENFKMQQDPNSGSYSVQFQQNAAPPPTNGT